MKLCEYGCGQEAKYPPRKGKRKWSCCEFVAQCPKIIENIRQKNIGKKRTSEQIENLSNGRKGKRNSPPVVLEKNIEKMCDFGCNQIAKYFFNTTKKYCCSYNVSKCPSRRKKISEQLTGHEVSNKTKKKISEKIKELNLTETKYKIKQSITRKYTIKDYKEKYPLFSKIEEMRYKPGKEKEKEIQVHCKNHKCKNSKENGGWFTPTGIQLYERIRQLEKEYGNDGCYLYCSDDCKYECPLYNLKSDPFESVEREQFYTQKEYNQFRDYVLTRDKYICQYCGKLAEHVHHERPQKLEPFHALDPDLTWSVCKKCHYEKGHIDECSTGNLAKIKCKRD